MNKPSDEIVILDNSANRFEEDIYVKDHLKSSLIMIYIDTK